MCNVHKYIYLLQGSLKVILKGVFRKLLYTIRIPIIINLISNKSFRHLKLESSIICRRILMHVVNISKYVLFVLSTIHLNRFFSTRWLSMQRLRVIIQSIVCRDIWRPTILAFSVHCVRKKY